MIDRNNMIGRNYMIDRNYMVTRGWEGVSDDGAVVGVVGVIGRHPCDQGHEPGHE
jgi:hypothetical protein